MTCIQHDVDEFLIEDICKLYCVEDDKYFTEYFEDVDYLNENMKNMSLDDFIRWFRKTYDSEVRKIMTEYFTVFAQNWIEENGTYASDKIAEFMYNNSSENLQKQKYRLFM